MNMEIPSFRVLFVVSLTISTIVGVPVSSSSSSYSSLKVGFYASSCPSVESVVRKVINKAVSSNRGMAPALIRMHFHDCFVRGCDASILLDSIPGYPSEKEHPANNPSLQGYEIIDEAKAQIEAQCPQTVSCADIIALAARDSAYITGHINYAVPTGRRDGRISLKDELTQNLPAPSFNATQLKENFANKGLSLDEMVTLSGAHSFGVSHCSSFSNRLYSFNSTHSQDPSMNLKFAAHLKSKCPRSDNVDSVVALDVVTPSRLDNKYYTNLEKGNGLLTSDQMLSTGGSTARMVRNNARYGARWSKKFAKAMVKMGAIDVLVGSQGEIRKSCRVVNY